MSPTIDLPYGVTWMHELDTWIVVIAALAAASCALLGCFLVLRRMSMMGDAISHAVLPGIAIAFLWTGSRDSVVMFVGAALVGVLTALFTQWVHRFGKVEESASMGVVFTVLFAVGLLLMVRAADAVDLDVSCVLYGAIELAPSELVALGNWPIPRAALALGSVLLVNTLFVALLFKELKLVSFDPALADTLGIHAGFVHYLLMTLVAVTTVAAFETVGSILVIAMLIVPAAAAQLLTDRLAPMLVTSVVIAVLAAIGGHLLAIIGPPAVGFAGLSTNTAGMIGVVAGALFVVAWVLSPRYGLLVKLVRRLRLSWRIVREDLLGLLYRGEEAAAGAGVPVTDVAHYAVAGGKWLTQLALWRLQTAGRVQRRADRWQLTPRGRAEAGALVRAHRLWETYFDKYAAAPHADQHRSAELLEHHTDAQLQRRLHEKTDQPAHDPQGREIPGG